MTIPQNRCIINILGSIFSSVPFLEEGCVMASFWEGGQNQAAIANDIRRSERANKVSQGKATPTAAERAAQQVAESKARLSFGNGKP